MKTVTEAVREILYTSDVAREALRAGVLNMSAFAEQIQPEVEQMTWKSVQKNTVVVALSRIALELDAVPALHPVVYIDELSIKAPLADITYERTETTLQAARQLSYALGLSPAQFLTITQGLNEITIIVSQERVNEVESHMKISPKSVFSNLVGMTMKFDKQYLPQPNVLYSLLSKLAHQRINLYEIVSTYTELTVFIDEAQLDKAVAVMNQLLRKSK